MTHPDDQAARAILDELTAAAGADLDAHSGGVAVCVRTKAGTPVPAIKLAEGRWASLRDVARGLDAGERMRAVLAATAATWSRRADTARARGAGPDWLAYYAGGEEGLAELARRLEAAAGATATAEG